MELDNFMILKLKVCIRIYAIQYIVTTLIVCRLDKFQSLEPKFCLIRVDNVEWFGGAFLSMSAQKSVMLADPISTLFKLGTIGNHWSSKKSCLQPQHNGHNNQTQHTP